MQESRWNVLICQHFRDYVQHRMISDYESQDQAEGAVRQQREVLLPRGISTPGHVFVSAFESDEEVGWGWIYVDPARSIGWIYNIQLFEKYRGRGWGASLISLLEEKAASAGARVLWLNVLEWNEPAKRLYESAGYRVVTRHMNKRLKAEIAHPT